VQAAHRVVPHVWIDEDKFHNLFTQEWGCSRKECHVIWSNMVMDPHSQTRRNNEGHTELLSKQFWA